MSAKTNNIRIGIFVLVAIFLFIVGILAFGAKSYFVTKSTLETAIEGEVYGLSVGSKVELRGVPIGKVSRIAFAQNEYPKSGSDAIVVEFQIEGRIFDVIGSSEKAQEFREAQIAKGLRAMIKGQGVTGTSILALEYFNPRENPPLEMPYKPRHPYIPSVPGAVTRMLESIEKSLRHLQEIDVVGIAHGVSNVLSSTRQLTDKLNQVDMVGISDNVNTLVVQLKDTVNELSTTIKGMKLDALSRNADELIVGFKASNEKLETVLGNIGSVPLQDTVGDLRSVMQTLNGVLEELKRYPSGFIFGEPPPPARSVEAPSR